MRNFSQRELLSEGFWDGFKSAAGRVARVGKFVGKHALPKTSEAIKKTWEYGEGLGDSMKSLPDLAAKNLKKDGYSMLKNTWQKQKDGDRFVVFATPISEYEEVVEMDPSGKPIIDPSTGQPKPVIDPKTGEQQIKIGSGRPVPFIVDKEGVAKQVHSKNYGSLKKSTQSTSTSTPSLSGGPVPTPTPAPVTTPTPTPIPSPSPSPTPSPTPSTPPRRTGNRRGGPPGGPRRTP